MTDFLTRPPQVINIAADSQNRSCRVLQVDFLPEAMGDEDTAAMLAAWNRRFGGVADDANAAAVKLLCGTRPMLTEIRRAIDCVPGMQQNLILHSGAPVTAFSMLGDALQRAVLGAALHEGLAFTAEEAAEKLADGRIRLDSAHCHQAAAARCGVISASMPVFCVRDSASGSWAYSPLPAFGPDKFTNGSCSEQAVAAMIDTETRLVPPLRAALLEHGDMDILATVSEGLLCGDNGCSRHRAGAALLCGALLRDLAANVQDPALLQDLLSYVQDEQLLQAAMLAALKCAASSIADLEDTTLLSCLCSDGRTLSARLAGRSETWLSLPLPQQMICGDELLCELFGIGSAALSSAPAVLLRCMLGERDALACMHDAYEAACGTDERFRLPYAAFLGAPICPDYRYMVRACKPFYILGDTEQGTALLNTGLSLPIAAVRELCAQQA